MDLKEKLARLRSLPEARRLGLRDGVDERAGSDRNHESEEDRERRIRLEQLRGMLRDMIARDRATVRASERSVEDPAPIPGAARETPDGTIHVVESVLEPHHCHGRASITRALAVCPARVAQLALDPTLAGIEPQRMLLLDTETTGLSGGTGTVPFLIGLAWFEDQSLRIEQLFLRRLGEERAMLRRLVERLGEASCVVSYNGKSFDWPLLRTRCVLHRIPVPELPPHLDLLHCARRVLKRRLGRVRLLDLETRLLGKHRERDIDGAEIPTIYLRYLRGQGARALATVIEHNANDLIALAAVLARLSEHFQTIEPADDPRDHLGYAEVAVRADDCQRALEFARSALHGGGDPEVVGAAALLAARIARQRRAYRDQEDWLLSGLRELEGAQHVAARIHLELAKLYEHRVKDPERALFHARLTIPAEDLERQGRRLDRLERRRRRSIDGGNVVSVRRSRNTQRSTGQGRSEA